MTKTDTGYWQARVEIEPVDLDEAEIDDLVTRLVPCEGTVGYGNRRVGVTLTATGDTSIDAHVDAVAVVRAALGDVGEIVAVEVLSDAEADARLARPAFPELVGIAEVAALLGVSRQRASELQKRTGFPAPVAVLRAGPIWRKGDLDTFASEWDRKPGRPRRDAATTTNTPATEPAGSRAAAR